jgi:hypothetical protein
MNERIRQLAEQAGITTNLDTDYFEKDINKWIDYYSEKFAELLVKDILVIVENYCETTPEIWGLPVEIVDHFDMEIEQ